MTVWRSEAIVLEAHPQGESDLRVSLATPAQGRLGPVAKGALRSKKRFVGVFELGNRIDAWFMVAPRSGMLMVDQASILDINRSAGQDPAALARLCLLLETASLVIAEAHPSRELYGLLKSGLEHVRREPDSDRWAVAYCFRMLAAAGYEPMLDSCVICGGAPDPKECLFDCAEGGAVCSKCAGAGRAPGKQGMSAAVSLDTARTLKALMSAPEESVGRFNFTRRSLRQARDILYPFIAYHLGREPRSLAFLNKLRQAGRR